MPYIRAYTHIRSTCPHRHKHATHTCVHMHSHTSTHSGEEGSVHSLLKSFQTFKFSQEPHSAVSSHLHGDSPFRTFQSDIVVTALNNGRKDRASRNSREKCAKAWTAACQDATAVFKPVVHTQT